MIGSEPLLKIVCLAQVAQNRVLCVRAILCQLKTVSKINCPYKYY